METGEDGERTQVVEVRTPTRAAKARLAELGLDLTEHGRRGSLEVVLHGKRDARVLRANGFDYDVEIADLRRRSRANRRADREYAARVVASDLPSGRDTYRRLPDYELELKELALQYPSLVRPLVLPNKSVLGRDVNAIEITANAAAVDDGKPIFLNMGVHHAREWPSSEHAMEFAYDLLRNYGADARATRLVDAARTIVLPIVNPDGFNISREGSRPPGTAAVRPVRLRDEAQELRRLGDHAGGSTARAPARSNPAGRLRGTDLNRNYGGLWGGSGASTLWSSDTFRGDAPFSEPEVQNVRQLQSTRAITNLITNHTYSNLVLRPPGVAAFGFPLEEPEYEALGAALAAHNGYSEPAGLPALRHDGRHRGLDVLDRRLARLHVRDRPRRVPSAVRDGRRRRVPRPRPRRGRRPGRQPRGLLHDARGHGGPGPARPHQRRGDSRRAAHPPQDVPDLHVARLAERLGHADRRPDPLRGHARVHARAGRAAVHLARQPVHPPRGGRPPRPRPHRPTAGGARRCPTRTASRPRTPAIPSGGPTRSSPSPCRGRTDGVDNGKLHRPRGVDEPGHGLGRLRPRRRGRGRDDLRRRPAGHDGGRRPLRPAARRVPGRPRDLRPGRRPAVRRVDRLGALRRPAAHHARGARELDAHVHPGGRDAGSRRRGRGGPRRASARSATSVEEAKR